MQQLKPIQTQHIQHAQQLLLDVLAEHAYLNEQKMNEIQMLAVGHIHYFELETWQQLLKSIHHQSCYFSDFLNFYLQNYPEIQKKMDQQMQKQLHVVEQFYQQHLKDIEITPKNLSAHWQGLDDLLQKNDAQPDLSTQQELLYLNYWLQTFTPLAADDIPLLWKAFQAYPFEFFPLVLNIPVTALKAQDIEKFYDLFAQPALDFAHDGQRPTHFIQYFYDQFPELLQQIPQRYLQSNTLPLKAKLLLCLADRKADLSEILQQFILQQFMQSVQQNEQTLIDAALHALAKCQQIQIPHTVMDKVRSFLHEDEIWYLPMVAMRTLNALGIRDLWFKQHLLAVLEQGYGCDGETPQGTSIEILTIWGKDGLYATDKVIQLLKQAIQENDQDSIMSLIAYTDADPSLAVHFQPLLWRWIEDLSQKSQDECWIEGWIFQTFAKLCKSLKWQPNPQQWHSMEVVLHALLEYLSPQDRAPYFQLLAQAFALDNIQIQALKQWCVEKDKEHQADNIDEES